MEVKVPEYKISPTITLRPRLTALIVVDMQVDFVRPQGKLFVPDAQATIPPICNLMAKARKNQVPIIFTQDWHRLDDPEFSIWPPHAIEGSRGARIVPTLAFSSEDHFVRKRTYDAFFSTDLDLLLRQMGVRTLVFSGTVSNICVLHTAGSARLRGYDIIAVADAISSLTPFDREAAWRQISFVYQGKIANSQGIKFGKR